MLSTLLNEMDGVEDVGGVVRPACAPFAPSSRPRRPPRPSTRTKRTRLVPPPVLKRHAASTPPRTKRTRQVLVGATNRPDMVDPALLRPGRFDLILEARRPRRAPRLPTVAPTHVPTVHSPPSLLLPLPMSLLYTPSVDNSYTPLVPAPRRSRRPRRAPRAAPAVPAVSRGAATALFRRPRGAAGERARVTGRLRAQVPLPDAAARLDILRTAVRGMALAEDAGGALPALAARLDGYTGAELRRLCTEAALAALRESIAAPEVSRHVPCPARARVRVRACWRMPVRACAPPPPPPPPPSRTNWTRLVPLPVLTGRVSSLLPYGARVTRAALRQAAL